MLKCELINCKTANWHIANWQNCQLENCQLTKFSTCKLSSGKIHWTKWQLCHLAKLSHVKEPPDKLIHGNLALATRHYQSALHLFYIVQFPGTWNNWVPYTTSLIIRRLYIQRYLRILWIRNAKPLKID